MSKNQYRSSRLEKNKKNLLMLRIGFWVIVCVAFLYGFIFWFNHQSLAISRVSVSETKFVSSDEILEVANTVLDEKYLGFFSKSNIIFIPSSEIKSQIANINPAIEKVSVSRNSSKELHIDVKEYEPAAKWCGRDVRVEKDLCYLMNKDGQFFSLETPIFKFTVDKFFGDIPEENIIGRYYLQLEYFANLLEFIQGLPPLNMVVDTIETEDFETFSIHTKAGPYILIEKSNIAKDILDNLQVVIAQEEINKAQLKNLIYIDLRFGNKVFYKIGTPLDPKN